MSGAGPFWRDTMKVLLRILFAASPVVLVAACATDNATSPIASSVAAAALVSAPITFDQLNTSFVGGSSPDDGFVPMGMGFGGGREDHLGPGWGSFMGGGIGEAFDGGVGLGGGFGGGPFGEIHDCDDGAVATTAKRVECAPETGRGARMGGQRIRQQAPS